MTHGNATCRTCQELKTDYLIAVDEAENAAHALQWAVTATQRASAARRSERVEQHKLYAMKELLGHCVRDGCLLPISEPVLAQQFVSLLFASFHAEVPSETEMLA